VPPLADAYAIQRSLHARSHLPVMVWKLALTSASARTELDADAPAVGRLPASGIYCDGSEVTFVGTEMFAEAELVFELGRDLPPEGAPYGRETVAAALKGIYPGIELARSRFVDSDLPLGLLVADNALAHGLVLGRKLSDGWLDGYADIPVTLLRNGRPAVTGSTGRVMGDPLDALVWIANWLCQNGEGGLLREQLVASGSCTGVTEVFPGDTIVADFNGTADARVSLSR
jgi:2-keto-4-pentenoate hydratase